MKTMQRGLLALTIVFVPGTASAQQAAFDLTKQDLANNCAGRHRPNG